MPESQDPVALPQNRIPPFSQILGIRVLSAAPEWVVAEIQHSLQVPGLVRSC